ncbi:CYTH and CHAD domain-containing protein [Actinopolymorpha sp. B17G11]|uniref:CYTH and CHAD domain-containing protein n=1 Tax=Actinopolymorpha sp. B17G11 TaxID=3160861 RepID=UPI0032E3E214
MARGRAGSGVETGTEVERKFGVDEAYAVPDLSDVVTVREEGTDVLVTTYLDSADLRLWRDGIVLRHRSGGPDAGWHLKFPAAIADGEGAAGAAGGGAGPDTRVRSEVRLPARRGDHLDAPPAELLGLVRVALASAQVSPRGRIRTERTRRTLLTPGGAELAELADDRVTVGPADLDERIPHPETASPPGTPHATGVPLGAFRELELEERDGAATPEGRRLLDAVATHLADAGAQPPAAESKAVQVLGDPAKLPPAVPPVPSLSPDAPAAAAVRAHLATYTRALRREDLRVRLDAEDSVHQLRVATRRLRSGLRAFRPLFVTGWEDALRTDLRWLATSFAPTRDAEVQLARLVDRAGRLPDAEATEEVQTFLRRRLGRELATSRGASLAVLDTDRYLALHHQLLQAADAPATVKAAKKPCAEVLPPLARRAYGRLEKATRGLDADAPDTRWHEVRITAKRARYAAEACAPALGKPARRLAGQLSRVTDVLGEHQDAVVAAATLTRLATSGRVPARVAYWLGVLHAEERAAARVARESFGDVWREAGRPRYHHWLDEEH